MLKGKVKAANCLTVNISTDQNGLLNKWHDKP